MVERPDDETTATSNFLSNSWTIFVIIWTRSIYSIWGSCLSVVKVRSTQRSLSGVIHLWLSQSGSASEAADVCKVPFRWEAIAAVADADPAKVSPESCGSKHGSPYVKRAASLKWSAAEMRKIWAQVCEWETHPPTVPLPQSYRQGLVAMNTGMGSSCVGYFHTAR